MTCFILCKFYVRLACCKKQVSIAELEGITKVDFDNSDVLKANADNYAFKLKL